MQPRRKSVHTLFKSVLKGSLAVFSFAVLAMLPAQADPGSGRTVKYSQQDIVSIRAKIRFSTLIVLPPNEDILDFATGDKEFWIINGVHNLCYVHPAKAGIRSDLHLVTSTGRVYSFLLTEVSNDPSREPDLKLFVEPKEESAVAGSAGLEKYGRRGAAEAYNKEMDAPRSATNSQNPAAEANRANQATEVTVRYPQY